MEKFPKSSKLDHVCYDIRGPVHKKALQLEEEGNKILKLNIGNPAPFGFEAPDEILVDVIRNLPTSQGYCDSKGLYSARKAIVHYYQTKGLLDVTVNDVYIGNGVSELITMSMQALLNDGDEILIPAPDYPLWTAAATLAGGTVRHYLCDEENNWFPNLADMEAKITPKTKAIVVINPNNPTGAVYSKEILLEIAELARKHGLIIFADEIYDKILYDDAVHHHIAALAPDLLTVTFNGLSKAYRVAGFRQGWMILNGPKHVPPHRCNTPFRRPWADTKASTNSSSPAAACSSNATKHGNWSTRFRAYPASNPWAHCICSPKSIPNCTASTMT